MSHTPRSRVRIVSPGSQSGRIGTVERVYPNGDGRPYLVRFDGEDVATWTFDDDDLTAIA